jgi:hypothetical protein
MWMITISDEKYGMFGDNRVVFDTTAYAEQGDALIQKLEARARLITLLRDRERVKRMLWMCASRQNCRDCHRLESGFSLFLPLGGAVGCMNMGFGWCGWRGILI